MPNRLLKAAKVRLGLVCHGEAGLLAGGGATRGRRGNAVQFLIGSSAEVDANGFG